MAEKQNVNTTKSIQGKNVNDASLKRDIERASKQIKDAKLVKFSIPKEMSRFIGSTMFISINGTSVNIPVDGETYKIPEPLADLGRETLAKSKM